MKFLTVVLAALIPGAVAARPQGAGTQFGETLMILMPARQAGTAWIPLEDSWRMSTVLEAGTVFLPPGVRWVDLGYQRNVGNRVRLGGEVFYFSTPSLRRTVEFSDGSFGGSTGTVRGQEVGGRIQARFDFLVAGPWRGAGVGRLSGMEQRLPVGGESAAGLELGLQVQRVVGRSERAILGWTSFGPLGGNAQRPLASHLVAGAGMVQAVSQAMFRRSGGLGVGGEVRRLSEGYTHGHLGLVYWIGAPHRPGSTLYLRGGLRSEAMTSRRLKPGGGMGLLWRGAGGWGWQLDYAVVDSGSIGFFHYMTLGLRVSG